LLFLTAIHTPALFLFLLYSTYSTRIWRITFLISYSHIHTMPFSSICHITLLLISDGHTFVYSLHRYRYCYIISNDRYKRTPSVICMERSNGNDPTIQTWGTM
jgi:hypothetical protein